MGGGWPLPYSPGGDSKLGEMLNLALHHGSSTSSSGGKTKGFCQRRRQALFPSREQLGKPQAVSKNNLGSEMGQKVWRFFFLGYIVEAGSCHESISGASLVMKASVLS